MRKSSAIWMSIAAIAFLAVFASPLYLQWLAGFRRANWTEIGNIGQAYGAASAILSALALLGIAMSISLQVREHYANRSQIVRSQQFRLIELALENPERYMPCRGLDWRERTTDDMCQHLYTTMLINNHYTGYSLGFTSEEVLRGEILHDIFAAESGRKWWAEAEEHWRRMPSAANFVDIVSDEYTKAISRNPSPIPSVVNKERNKALPVANNERRSHATKIALGGLAGVIIGVAVAGARRKAT
ncbi:DUF6082 family protein [Actinoallomurus iriomotensis]|uniref:Uncharacterized protein n=1 Tax=Actinoallomurus iriomotensis TaxID=478107 RepID=A0A9W6RVG3_9ACTN|nr:DUF6082 family protein [Actinoallomurus iriomotensis]GLY83366.1 hypothetical protein Airi02_012960 [Actinoallomurus iriomotensis]